MNSHTNRFSCASETTWLILIAACGLGIRLLILLVYPHIPESDELAYLSMARNFIAGNGFIDSAGNYAMYNVGYPLFIVSPMLLFFGDTLTPIRIANVLLGLISILMCHSVARAAGGGKIARLLAATMLALYLPTSLYGVYIFKENLMIPLMLGVVWCALRLIDRAQMSIVIGCGILIGLLALTGNAALSLCLPLAFALLFYSNKKVQGAGWLMFIALIAVFTTAPWVVRNNHVLGAPVLNTNGGFNLYLGNNPNADGMYMSIADTPRGGTWNDLRKSGEVNASQTLKHEALEWISANPGKFAHLAFVKIIYFWTPPLHDGKSPPSKFERLVRGAWVIQFFIFTAAALGSVLVPGLRNRRCVILWLSIASYSAVHMLFYVIFRYREPIIPLVCVLAALSIEKMYTHWFAHSAAVGGR